MHNPSRSPSVLVPRGALPSLSIDISSTSPATPLEIAFASGPPMTAPNLSSAASIPSAASSFTSTTGHMASHPSLLHGSVSSSSTSAFTAVASSSASSPPSAKRHLLVAGSFSLEELRAFVNLVRNFAEMNGIEPEYMNPDEFSTIHLNRPEALRARTERQLVRLWNDCGRALLADGADVVFKRMTKEVSAAEPGDSSRPPPISRRESSGSKKQVPLPEVVSTEPTYTDHETAYLRHEIRRLRSAKGHINFKNLELHWPTCFPRRARQSLRSHYESNILQSMYREYSGRTALMRNQYLGRVSGRTASAKRLGSKRILSIY